MVILNALRRHIVFTEASIPLTFRLKWQRDEVVTDEMRQAQGKVGVLAVPASPVNGSQGRLTA